MTFQFDAFLALEKGFRAQKYPKKASNQQKSLMNYVGHVPKYICTKFQVIWFTLVAVIQKTGFLKFPKTGQNQFFGCFSLQRPKMTLTQKTQKNPIYKRIFLSFMTLNHFWPLVAEKGKNQIFEISKKYEFWLFQPPEAQNDPDTENTKEPDL